MNSTISPGARLLLDLIYRTETGRAPPACYDTIIGHRENQLQKPITAMTLDELLAAQRTWGKRWKSSAAGAPQIIRSTLAMLVKRLGLSGKEKFDAALQDRMAFELLTMRGWHDFAAGKITPIAFGNALAKEWASFPVLVATQGAHGRLRRGQSFYDGDGLNSALVSPEQVEATLRLALAAERRPMEAPDAPEAPEVRPTPPTAPAPAPGPVVIEKPVVADPGELEKHPAKSKTVWTWALAGIGSIVTAIGEALGKIDWRVQMFIAVMIAGFAIYGIKRRFDLARAVKDLKAEIG